jgi:hypothetical protein
LNAGNFKSLPAAHILAGQHVVPAQHIGAGFGEAGTVTFVGAARKLALFGAHQPGDFVFSGLMTMRTVQRSRLFVRPLIEKFTFIHKQLLPDGRYPVSTKINYYSFNDGMLWQDERNAEENEEEI